MTLNGSRLKTITRIKIPENLTIERLPKDSTFSNMLGSYQATYTQKDDEITVTRQLIINPNYPVVSAENYPFLLEIDKALNKDLKQQAFYQITK